MQVEQLNCQHSGRYYACVDNVVSASSVELFLRQLKTILFERVLREGDGQLS